MSAATIAADKGTQMNDSKEKKGKSVARYALDFILILVVFLAPKAYEFLRIRDGVLSRDATTLEGTVTYLSLEDPNPFVWKRQTRAKFTEERLRECGIRSSDVPASDTCNYPYGCAMTGYIMTPGQKNCLFKGYEDLVL